MAYEWGPRQIESYAASGDLSAAQYRVGKQNADRTISVAGAGQGHGIIEISPIQSKTVGIVTDGVNKVVLGGTVAVGDPLIADANGAAVKRVAQTGIVFGTAREAGVAGQIIAARVDFAGAQSY